MSSAIRPAARISIAGAGCLLAAAAAVANWSSGDRAAEGAAVRPDAAGRGAWEYKVLPRAEIVDMAPGHRGEYILPKDLLADLNGGLGVLGSEGWELVAVEPYHTEGYVKWPAMYVFRRAK